MTTNSQRASARPTLDQRRARHAWEAIQELLAKTASEADRKEYAGEAKKLPIRIVNAGLGQALVFIHAKAKDKKPNLKLLNEHLTDWTLHQRGLPGSKPDSLLNSIIYGDSDFLRRATDEVLAYLQWLNRFAEAEDLTDLTAN